MSRLIIGEVYRYSSSLDSGDAEVDGLPNLLHHTSTIGCNKVLLEAGINPIGAVKTREGSIHTPAILVRSSINKHGKKDSPWRDEFDVDNGYVRYFGDNKRNQAPQNAPGNRILLEQFRFHKGAGFETRSMAVPILLFRSIRVGKRVKGNLRFEGLGLLKTCSLVTQFQEEIGYFTNFVFEFDILDLSAEQGAFNWDWISQRRDNNSLTSETLNLAPQAWKEWLKNGEKVRQKVKRKVIKSGIINKKLQIPEKESVEGKLLGEIYRYYKGKEHHFELLASKIVASLIRRDGLQYDEGWITKRAGDGGVDFVGKLSVGSDIARTDIVLLGQAKCEDPRKPTSGIHLARTVARLQRGWIGAFVTTSYFSEHSQLELKVDKYPLILVNGKLLSQQMRKLMEEVGQSDVKTFLSLLEADYESSISDRRPEEILN